MITVQPNEQVLKQAQSMYFKSALKGIKGILYVTNQRVVFERTINAMFGLIGLLAKSNRPGVEVDMPKANVVSAEQTKVGLNSKVILLKTANGEEYKFEAKPEDWLPLFNE